MINLGNTPEIETKPRVAFHTLGCKLNFSETATIARDFSSDKFERVDFESPAEVYVINTCSVTENADKKFKGLVKKALQQNLTLQALENMKIKFKVYNYTAHKKNITQFLLKQIGANDDLISSYDQAKIVNRSLSYAEIIFQIAVNRYALNSKCDNFKSGHFCDIVVDTIANDKKACIYPSLDSYTKIIKANEQFISFFNQYLTEPEVLTASNHDFQEFQSTHSDSMLGDITSLEKMLEIFSHYDFSKNIQKIA